MTWKNQSQRHAMSARGIKTTYNAYDTRNIRASYNVFRARGNLEIVNKVVEYYGTTDDPIKAGFILPNGSMLDLSGGHKVRSKEHAEVARDIGVSLPNVMDSGIIRIGFSNKFQQRELFIQLHKPLTQSQKRTIAGIIKDYDSTIISESKHGNYTSQEFDSIGRIMMNIDNITKEVNV